MLSSRAVCSRCTAQLRAHARQPAAKLALFSSVADTTPDAQPSQESQSSVQGETRRRRHHVGPQRPRQGGERRRPDSGASAFEMYHHIVNAQGHDWAGKGKALSGSAPSETTTASSGPPSEVDLLFTLSSLIKQRSEPVKTRLEAFKQSIWPQLQAYGTSPPPHIAKLATTFLDAVCKDVARFGQPAIGLELVRLTARLGITRLHIPNTIALSICHQLATQKNTTSSRVSLSQQLLELWMQVSQMQRSSEVDQLPRFTLPDSLELRTSLKETQHIQKDPYSSASVKPAAFLDSLFPQFGKAQTRELMDGLLATLCVFSDPRLTPPHVQREAEPLLQLASLFATEYSADADSMMQQIFSRLTGFPADKATELGDYMKQQWPVLVTFLTDTDQPWRVGSTRGGAEAALAILHKRLRKAHRTRNRPTVQSIWMELYDGQVKNAQIRQELQAKPDYMDFWIFVLCALRLTPEFKTAIGVMRQLQIPLTLKSYTGMLYGWRLCKDIPKIEKLWDQLVAAGVQLDAAIWTERLSALILKGQAQECIKALAALQKKWEAAVAADQVSTSGAVQPTIEMINAVIKGVLDMDPKAAKELLAWAHNNDIKPNVSTHNIILRKAFAAGPADVAWVMDAMAKGGIEPNEATFTILIEELLALTGDDTPEQQVAAVHQVFADLARADVRQSSEVYAKALHAVASLANGADEAVDAVMEHLRYQNVRVSEHMVTILIERALLRSPGDFAPVQAILEKYGVNELKHGDQTLWERVMRGAAVSGRPGVALDLFDKLAAAQRPATSLPCLTELLVALLNDAGGSRREDARRVVDVVLKTKTAMQAQKGAGSDMHDERFWKHHFWFVAKGNNLLDLASVPLGLRNFVGQH